MNVKALFLSFILSIVSLSAEVTPVYENIDDQSKLKILTPSLSRRETAKIRLNNGLEALLISDPEGNQSAAALSMNVGSWNNPPEYPGVAHFLEHLLFLASDTYPDEDGYMKYVFNNGGTVNAYTAHDRTVYIFSVNHDAFPSTLDYFAHMFIDPTFSPSGIGRELHAVDQEHDKNIERDAFRQYMVMKATCNQNHPNAQFTTGNSETLGSIPRAEVINWYQENYSSDKAHLVIYSSLPIDELKEMTSSIFSKMPQKSTSEAATKQRIFSSSQEGSIVYITPVKELRNLSILWELPEKWIIDIENKSHVLISYALSSQHPGSLYRELKDEGLIDSLSASLAPYSRNTGFFAVEFTLTPKGVNEYETVLTRFFQTLSGLKEKGIPSYIFSEMKRMAKLNYAYQGREHPYHYVSELVSDLVNEPIETFPDRTVLPTRYDPKASKNLLSLFKPEKAYFQLMAAPTLTGIPMEETEKWSGAEYTMRKIDTSLITAWNQAKPSPHISVLPAPNPFIPSNVQLVTQKQEVEENPIPECLVNTMYGKVYYWEDSRYLVPDVSWNILIKSPELDRSARQITLQVLTDKCLSDAFEMTSFYAQTAGLTFSSNISEQGVMISVDGYSDKAPMVLQQGLEKIKTCSWSREEFELQKSMLIDSYENFRKKEPYMQGIDLFRSLISNTTPRTKDQLEELKTVTYEEFQTYQNKVFEKAYVEMILTGNLTKEEAYSTWEQVRETLSYTPFQKEEHHKKKILVLPTGKGPYKINENLDCLGNAAFLAIQQGPFCYEKWASSAIFAQELRTSFFETLRTKQQTGYITMSGTIEEEEQLMQYFMVQSTTHQPDELIARFELFVENYAKDFEAEFSEGQFENIRQTLINLEKQPPSNLSAMSAHLFRLAFIKDGDFLRSEKKIEALKALNYETFKQDCIAFSSRNNSKRIAISLVGEQPEGKAFCYQEITADALKTEGAYITWRQ